MPKQPVTLVAGLVLMAIAIALMLATLPPLRRGDSCHT